MEKNRKIMELEEKLRERKVEAATLNQKIEQQADEYRERINKLNGEVGRLKKQLIGDLQD